MDILQSALYWTQEMKISVCPLHFRSKIPDSKALCQVGYKKEGRATWLPLKSEIPTESQVRQWFGNGVKRNLALITGWQSLVVLDFDDMQRYADWVVWQMEANPQCLDTLIVQSSRGLHYYYFCPKFEKPIKNQYLDFEIKSHGSMVTTIPSVHKSGIEYQAVNDKPILTVDNHLALLTFSPVELKRPARNLDPWTVRDYTQQVDLLALFPDARQTDTEGRYYLSHCPLHGHRWNFWLDTELKIAGCYGGCGQFLFSELVNIVKV